MELQRELGADLSVDVSYEWYVLNPNPLHTVWHWLARRALPIATPSVNNLQCLTHYYCALHFTIAHQPCHCLNSTARTSHYLSHYLHLNSLTFLSPPSRHHTPGWAFSSKMTSSWRI
jgi:hypothetical protein